MSLAGTLLTGETKEVPVGRCADNVGGAAVDNVVVEPRPPVDPEIVLPCELVVPVLSDEAPVLPLTGLSTTTVLSSGQVSDRPETLDRKVSKGCESTGFEETCRSGERRGQETLAEHRAVIGA